jgi:hypothetical protein
MTIGWHSDDSSLLKTIADLRSSNLAATVCTTNDDGSVAGRLRTMAFVKSLSLGAGLSECASGVWPLS